MSHPSVTMASKLTPLLFRTAARSAASAPRSQIRAFTAASARRSDTLSVVSQHHSPALPYGLSGRKHDVGRIGNAGDCLHWDGRPCCYRSGDSPALTEALRHQMLLEEHGLIHSALYSTATLPTTTRTFPSSSLPRMRPSSPRSSSGIPRSTRGRPSCPCSTSDSDSTVSPRSAS